MTPDELRQRTRQFAMAIIRFRRRLPATEESRAIGRQLIRAGTAVGAAYRAVCRCKSDPDFIAKLGTAIEEADEPATGSRFSSKPEKSRRQPRATCCAKLTN